MQTFKVLLLDFDGVIADSSHVVVKRFNAILKHFKKDLTITEEILQKYWTGDWRGFFKEHLKLLDEEIDPAGALYDSFSEEIPPPFQDIKEVLTELSKNHILLIVSSSPEAHIQKFLAENAMTSLFADVYSSDRLGSYTKPSDRAFLMPIEDYALSRETVCVVGDSIGDIELAHRVGISAIACTWGWNTKETLEAVSPEFIAHTPKDLLAFLM